MNWYWLFFLGMIGLIVFLIVLEYRHHDCINGKNCAQMTPRPLPDDSPEVAIDKINAMIQAGYSHVRWRQAAIVGLIMTLPIVYFLTQQMPSVWVWLSLALIIGFGVYFSLSWIHAHFYYPTSRQMEQNLLLIRDKLMARKNSPKKSGK